MARSCAGFRYWFNPHLMQICLHELKDNVDVLELARARREHDVLDFHYVCREGTEFHQVRGSMQNATWQPALKSDAHLGAEAIAGA